MKRHVGIVLAFACLVTACGPSNPPPKIDRTKTKANPADRLPDHVEPRSGPTGTTGATEPSEPREPHAIADTAGVQLLAVTHETFDRSGPSLTLQAVDAGPTTYDEMPLTSEYQSGSALACQFGSRWDPTGGFLEIQFVTADGLSGVAGTYNKPYLIQSDTSSKYATFRANGVSSDLTIPFGSALTAQQFATALAALGPASDDPSSDVDRSALVVDDVNNKATIQYSLQRDP